MLNRLIPCVRLSFALPLLLAISLSTAEAQVTLAPAVDSLEIGVPTEVRIAHPAASGVRFQYPDEFVWPDSLVVDSLPQWGGLELIRRTETTPTGATFLVRTFEIDTVQVPPLPVLRISGEDSTLLYTDARLLFVRSSIDSTITDLQPIAPLATFPRPWWHYAVAVLGLALLGWGIYRAFVWFTSRPTESSPVEEVEEPIDERTPLERAIEAFEALPPPGETKEAIRAHYYAQSHIVRAYLEEQFGVAALESTTQELAVSLSGQAPVTAAMRADLIQQLEAGDLVKYADVQQSPEVSVQSAAALRQWIETTDARLNASAEVSA
jgi:hypothetical protein